MSIKPRHKAALVTRLQTPPAPRPTVQAELGSLSVFASCFNSDLERPGERGKVDALRGPGLLTPSQVWVFVFFSPQHFTALPSVRLVLGSLEQLGPARPGAVAGQL